MAKPQHSAGGKVRYVLVPGWATSAVDGRRYFHSAADLVRLYKLPPGTYRLAGDNPDAPTAIERARKSGLVPLYARSDGDYTLPADDAPATPAQERPRGRGKA